jgi:DNA polymerase-3 subunit epsilon
MEIKRCLIVDTETTGVDPAKDSVIEIGAILYSVTNNTPIASVSCLIPAQSNPAEEINTISMGVLNEVKDYCVDVYSVDFFSLLYSMADCADVFVAHQASFDKDFMTGVNLSAWSSKPWLCTREDFRFAYGKPGDSLVNLTLAHKVGVTHNHRALTDCELIARIFGTYTPPDLQLQFQHAILPRAPYVALTSFAQKDLPKAAGFSWNPVVKKWWRRLTESEAAAITTFPIQKVDISAIRER